LARPKHTSELRHDSELASDVNLAKEAITRALLALEPFSIDELLLELLAGGDWRNRLSPDKVDVAAGFYCGRRIPSRGARIRFPQSTEQESESDWKK
jgi:hypothetical protein